MASVFGGTRVRQLLLVRFLEQLRPRRVLEVGSGNGVNLMLLACRFPEIEFTGIELTGPGSRAASRFQELPSLPAAMQTYAPLPLADVTAFRRIRFLRGSGTSLPFADGHFDLVLTVEVLAEMERVWNRALAEIARVVRRHALMIEPFRDVNDRGWSRRYVLGRNYFRARIADLSAWGIQPTLVLDDLPQEPFLHLCAVLAEKRA